MGGPGRFESKQHHAQTLAQWWKVTAPFSTEALLTFVSDSTQLCCHRCAPLCFQGACVLFCLGLWSAVSTSGSRLLTVGRWGLGLYCYLCCFLCISSQAFLVTNVVSAS